LKLHRELTRAGREEVCGCGWGKIRKEIAQEILFDNPPLETLDDSISDIITKVERAMPTEKAGTSRDEPCSVLSTRSRKHYHEPEDFSRTLPGRLNKLKEKAAFSLEIDQSLDSSEA
jgi:hypothetical protein